MFCYMGIKSGKNPTLDKLQQTNLSMSMPLVYQVYSMLKHQCSGTGVGGGGGGGLGGGGGNTCS